MEKQHYTYANKKEWSVTDLLELNAALKEQELRLTGERLEQVQAKMAQVSFEISSRGKDYISSVAQKYATA